MSDDENTTKPAGPPGAKKPDGPDSPGSKKPQGPPSGGKKPAGPPSSGGKKPAGPPSSSGSKKPAMPPGMGGDGAPGEEPPLSREDFQTDQDVRWCPGCGDYVILAQVQRLMPELDVPKENIVFISGIGCAGRFPYYMKTYGMHSIHGRAPAVATGLKTAHPELDVWIVTGDGDALSIGGNHLIHVLRRNVDTQILLFNNEIYGLTKGQYSPTSEQGKVTKSTPYGSVDRPVNPVGLALGSDASYVARTMDRDPVHLKDQFKLSHEHTGTAFVEIYQNCHVFNDGAFFEFTERDTKPQRSLFLEDGEPMLFDDGKKGLRVDPVSVQLEVVDLEESGRSVDDVQVHDAGNKEVAHLLGQIFGESDLPRPFGVIYREDRPTYEQLVNEQIETVREEEGEGDLETLLHSGDTWTVT